MRKTSLSIIITLLFLNTGIFLQPDDSHGANSNDKVLKPLQYFVNIGRLADGVKKQIEERGKVDVIVTLNDDEAQERARQMRTAQGLSIDNAAIIEEKARMHAINKGRVLAEIATNDYTLLNDYDNFPVIYIEVNENALKKLLHNPAVKSVRENNVSVPSLTESRILIRWQEANNAGATGAGTSVAVLDTGVDYDTAIFPAFGNCGVPPATCDQSQLPPLDPACTCRVEFAQDFTPQDDGLRDDPTFPNPNRHGTHVSGIILGVATATRILGLDVFSGAGAQDAHILSALNWVLQGNPTNVTRYNVRAVNMSLGTANQKYPTPCPWDNLASAIANLKSAGVITVIASGNDGFTDGISRPACIPDAISVGSVYDDDAIASQNWGVCSDADPVADMVVCSSNRAPFITMQAPGAIILAAGMVKSGTSMASAHVSGAVAAIRQVLPGLSPDSVRSLLTSTGTPVTRDNIVKPRLDLGAATPISCPNPARIGTTNYASLQQAYDAAGNGATILATRSISNLNLNTDNYKSVTIQGGYDCNFTQPPSPTRFTYVHGSIQTRSTSGSGTLTLKNVILH